jgi:L-seryl-tRNA(Ser) seleniumtransferase
MPVPPVPPAPLAPPVELRKLPKVDLLVDTAELGACRSAVGHRVLVAIAREVLAGWRVRVREGEAAPEVALLVGEIREAVRKRLSAGLRPVVNATGVLLHTNLGRAPLGQASIDALGRLGRGYSSVELDVETGERSRRGASAEAALAELCRAEAALIVNNNAAAVLLALTAISSGREVVVSRGELVEIGGGFRIPDILARSGATLVEVGTTNRTRLEDYERATSARTACILRVHPSNFTMTGFVERPRLAELAALARARGIPLVKDLGGGLVVERALEGLGIGLPGEPAVQACLEAGADLVTFSLDKLFGGPQGGAAVGACALVDRLRADPLARAVRVDKLTLAALEPVIADHARGDYDAIPVLRQLRLSVDSLAARVRRWQAELGDAAARTALVEVRSATGGGTLGPEIPSVALAIDAASPDELAARLRAHTPAVLARIDHGRVLLDPRTVLPGEDDTVVAALRAALGGQ